MAYYASCQARGLLAYERNQTCCSLLMGPLDTL